MTSSFNFHFRQFGNDLTVLCIPPITARPVLGERRLPAFDSHIAATHDTLSYIIEAMGQVPWGLGGDLVSPVRNESRVDLGHVI